jgi:hypothetical protein
MGNEDIKTERSRAFIYRGSLPPALGLLFLAPVLLLFLSVAAVALAGGTVAAFALPLLLGRRAGRRADDRSITLEPDQYSHIDDDRRQLPPR